ncbi:MAG: bifunctional riboflavin kinase/FAD synthetase [Flavobacteriaceae bacterium]|nr:MAG: bifunctional riboflavin kinase/FAD synthetase [Flavobacteriaceae bacterium]
MVTIGTFDGVHIGHQKILERLISDAKKQKKESVLLTFFPHPRMVLQKNPHIELINTIDEKITLLEKTGLDYLIIHPFNKDFSRLTALDFVRNILVNQLKTAKLVIGYDHHFGKNREGNIDQLREYNVLYDFGIEEIPAQDINDVSISSTKIRNALHEGNIETANRFLGYRFMISGNVVNGKQLGGKMGFPTANIHVKEPCKLIPKAGVYIVRSTINGKVVNGMMNIGYRPTVGGKHRTIEVHFFDFDQDLYRRELTIEFIHFLRAEQKFESIDELMMQLKKDKMASLDYLENNL